MTLEDNYGRPLLNLRIAITEKCNLSCAYCHNEGLEKNALTNHEEMKREEISRIVKVAIGLGISRVKLTGGEPLLRKDVVDIVEDLAKLSGLTDLSMTTNGSLLADVAEELHQHGLARVNISIPTLDDDAYQKLTGGRLHEVIRGIGAAIDSGFKPVKLNMLVLNGINDQSVGAMIEFAKKAGAILQVIELEPVNITPEYFRTHHRPLDQFESRLKEEAITVDVRRFMQNRHVYHLKDATVEVIRPIENTSFCKHCTRLRVTSDGKLKPCLMNNDNLIDVLKPMRNGADDTELSNLLRQANRYRKPYCESDS